MSLSERGEAHREAWRSPSGGVAEPVAVRKCRNIFSPSLSILYKKNFSGFTPLVRLHLAERLLVNLHLARWHELCSYLHFRRGAKIYLRTFAFVNR